MSEVICYTAHLPCGEWCELSFWDIFADERWANGRIECPEVVYEQVGGLNQKLCEKQNYEFLLRVAKYFSIKAVGIKDIEDKRVVDTWESWRTDCYIVGKYQQEMIEQGCFDLVVSDLLTQVMQWSESKAAINLLESMISHTQEYFEIDDNTSPFLIYRGADTCYNVLNLMADELVGALRQCHQRVEIYDVDKGNEYGITKYIGRHFKAVIGIQSCLFTVKTGDKKTYLHDLIIGPKYNILLDHPAFVKEIIMEGPQNYYLLLHDRNYISFAEKYFKNISGSVYFPCAGVTSGQSAEKCYDISFIGTYRDYRESLKEIRSWEKNKRFLGARFLRIMKRNPDYPAEIAFKEALEYYRINVSDEEFLNLFYEMRECCFCMMRYWREKVVVTLLEEGLEIHVFSETWKNCPINENDALICHPALDIISSLKIMQKSKISLNVMSGHKDGLTERVLNGMLCRSVVFSDKSVALEQNFVNGEDCVFFSLNALCELPLMLKKILEDERRLKTIVENGYKKAKMKHLWIHRVEQLVKTLDC